MKKIDTDTINFGEFDSSDLDDLGAIASHLETHFAAIQLVRQVKESVLAGNANLVIQREPDAHTIDIIHLGTSIRLQLLLAFNEKSEPSGKVICTLRHSILGKELHELLGAFSFNRSGMTSLPADERGRPHSLPKDADIIVAYFLKKAHATNDFLEEVVRPR